jgi:hypothetical protein
VGPEAGSGGEVKRAVAALVVSGDLGRNCRRGGLLHWIYRIHPNSAHPHPISIFSKKKNTIANPLLIIYIIIV